MRSASQLGRLGAVLVLGLAACEVLIMISPFAGFFYGGVRFEPFLGFLSESRATAWLNGFFLNHSVVTTSSLLEWQRTIGEYLFALGLWGFLISALQLYGKKALGRGVAHGLLYRFSRHPQYLSLGIAGLGLLTIWPRFLLLVLFVTMLFLYAGLARFEEWRMAERYGEAYRTYARGRGSFLPGSPAHRLFEATFGKLRPAALGWVAAYTTCLAVALLAASGLRGYVRSHTVVVDWPTEQAVVVSAWPQSEEWVNRTFKLAISDEDVREELRQSGDGPLVATILPPRYVMKGMYYKMPPDAAAGPADEGGAMAALTQIGQLAVAFLVPIEGVTQPDHFMGVDPESTEEPVEVVFSRPEKPYAEGISVEEALDTSVRLTPLVVVDVNPKSGEVVDIRVPLRQNSWGPQVVMPIF
jgi:protein-S-isoprenylcysteine O-methyltransferase Ste14